MSTIETPVGNNANNEQLDWIEQPAVPNLGFRLWHVMFMAFSAFLTLVILICCCVKIRIPRTKQEIEADYQRKKIAHKFRDRLRLIQNQDMDNMDLQLALERVRKDFNSENNIEIECVSGGDSTNSSVIREGSMKAEPQQPVHKTRFGRKLTNLMFSKQKQICTDFEEEKLNKC